MSLSKEFRKVITIGSAGAPGSPGSPAIPGHYQTTTTYTLVWYWSPAGEDSLTGYWYPVKKETTTTVWIPAVAAVPAVAATPSTPSQITYYKRQGWNSHSRTIESIAVGEGLRIYCATGISGLILGLAPAYFTLNPNSYHHGFSVDHGGVKVIENGIIRDILFPQQLNPTEIRLYRQNDNTIVYCAVNGADTYVYKSQTANSDSRAVPLFGFAWIYSSGDFITIADLISGEVQFGAA